MPATIVMGGQWGDEGKGKLIDYLATTADVVVRANGGANAGHTVETEQGIFKFHLVPSGILNPECICVIGAGVVIDPRALLREMDDLRSRGFALRNLRLADRAHVVMDYHPLLDELEETLRGEAQLGTTRRGNGPAYADKIARRGIRVADLLDEAALLRKLTVEINYKNRLLAHVYGADTLDATRLYHEYLALGGRLAEFVVPAEIMVQDAIAMGAHVLIECAQGAMLDIDYGTYPFVTSSSPTAAGACQGAGVAPTQVDTVLGVYKAYSTRVGAGPLPTELVDATGNLLRERGREYGTTTGRPRRIGWFDAVAARYVARLSGITEIAVTLLDVLDVFDEIKVCTAYHLNEVTIDHLPASDDLMAQVTPVYDTLPGWRQETTQARTLADLPPNALAYIRFLETKIGVPITRVGVGPGREQIVPLGGA